MARPQEFDVWGGGGGAGYQDRHKQGISSSNPFCTTAGALDTENEQNYKRFRSNHILVVLNDFILQTYF